MLTTDYWLLVSIEYPPEQHLRAEEKQAHQDAARSGAHLRVLPAATRAPEADEAQQPRARTEQYAEIRHERVDDEGARKLSYTIELRCAVCLHAPDVSVRRARLRAHDARAMTRVAGHEGRFALLMMIRGAQRVGREVINFAQSSPARRT